LRTVLYEVRNKFHAWKFSVHFAKYFCETSSLHPVLIYNVSKYTINAKKEFSEIYLTNLKRLRK